MTSRYVSKIRGRDPNRLKRVTLIIPDVLDVNLEYFCSLEDRLKKDVIAQALRDYLNEQGLNPDTYPTHD